MEKPEKESARGLLLNCLRAVHSNLCDFPEIKRTSVTQDESGYKITVHAARMPPERQVEFEQQVAGILNPVLQGIYKTDSFESMNLLGFDYKKTDPAVLSLEHEMFIRRYDLERVMRGRVVGWRTYKELEGAVLAVDIDAKLSLGDAAEISMQIANILPEYSIEYNRGVGGEIHRVSGKPVKPPSLSGPAAV